MREILTTETALLMRIAHLHESIPKTYVDTYEVTDLDITLRYESMLLQMKHRQDKIIVIEESDTLCAFLWYHISETVHIKSTYVAPQYRNQGYATQLKRHIESIAKANNIQTIYSDVHMNNKKMRQLNQKLGYETVMDYHRTSDERIRMIKMIEV